MMSLVKSAEAAALATDKSAKTWKKTRNWYQCRRCRYHGQFVFLAGGHYQICPFRNCTCQACRYVSKDTERAGQRMREWRRTKKERALPNKPATARLPAPGHPSLPSPNPPLPQHPPLPLLPAATAAGANTTAFGGLLQAAVEQRSLMLGTLVEGRSFPPSQPPLILPTIPAGATAASSLGLASSLNPSHSLAEKEAEAEEAKTSAKRRYSEPGKDWVSLRESLATLASAEPKSEPLSPPVSVIVQAPLRKGSEGSHTASDASTPPNVEELRSEAKEDEPQLSWHLSSPEILLSLLRLREELWLGFAVSPAGDVTLSAGEQSLRLSDEGATVRVQIESATRASDNRWPKAGPHHHFILFLRTLICTLLQLS